MIRLVVSDPETGNSYQMEADDGAFAGHGIGDEFDGEAVGLDGYTLEITGGSDDTGRPMRGDVEGQGIEEILVSGGTGFNPERDGERRRVSVRGGQVADATVQVNTKVMEEGDEDLSALVDGGDDGGDEDETDE